MEGRGAYTVVDGHKMTLGANDFDNAQTVAASVGLDADKALKVIDKRSYAAHVDDDWQRASELGVTAVPTSIYRQQALVGFQAYASYRQLIAETR